MTVNNFSEIPDADYSVLRCVVALSFLVVYIVLFIANFIVGIIVGTIMLAVWLIMFPERDKSNVQEQKSRHRKNKRSKTIPIPEPQQEIYLPEVIDDLVDKNEKKTTGAVTSSSVPEKNVSCVATQREIVISPILLSQKEAQFIHTREMLDSILREEDGSHDVDEHVNVLPLISAQESSLSSRWSKAELELLSSFDPNDNSLDKCRVVEIARSYQLFPSALVDEINEKGMEICGDTLIEENDEKFVIDKYNLSIVNSYEQ